MTPTNDNKQASERPIKQIAADLAQAIWICASISEIQELLLEFADEIKREAIEP